MENDSELEQNQINYVQLPKSQDDGLNLEQDHMLSRQESFKQDAKPISNITKNSKTCLDTSSNLNKRDQKLLLKVEAKKIAKEKESFRSLKPANSASSRDISKLFANNLGYLS